jgi:MFS family permease
MTTVTSHPAPARPSSRGQGWVLAIVLGGQFMAILDVSIVNVAAPTIRSDLGTSGSALQLIISGYMISYAMLLITGARLGGRSGPRPVFLYGLTLFTAASLACGLAGSATWLVAFRLAQGAGAALMVPQVLSVIQLGFTGAARTRALGAYATVLSGGVVVGQVLGGVLVDADLFDAAWRPVFLLNVPIGAVLLVLGSRLLPREYTRYAQGMDPGGLVTLSAAVTLLVVPLVLGHEEGWPGWTWASMAACVLVFAVFVLVERRAASPLVPMSMLRSPGLVPAAVAIFLLMSGYGGFLFSYTLHLQAGLGDGPLRAGLTFVPAAVSFACTGLFWRRLPARLHRQVIIAGTALVGVTCLLLALDLRGGGHGGAGLWVLLSLYGLALGAAYGPMLAAALAHVAPEHAPGASGLMATMLQLGQVIGVATYGSLYLSLTPSAHAVAVTSVALGGSALVSGAAALPLLRRRQAA